MIAQRAHMRVRVMPRITGLMTNCRDLPRYVCHALRMSAIVGSAVSRSFAYHVEYGVALVELGGSAISSSGARLPVSHLMSGSTTAGGWGAAGVAATTPAFQFVFRPPASVCAIVPHRHGSGMRCRVGARARGIFSAGVGSAW